MVNRIICFRIHCGSGNQDNFYPIICDWFSWGLRKKKKFNNQKTKKIIFSNPPLSNFPFWNNLKYANLKTMTQRAWMSPSQAGLSHSLSWRIFGSTRPVTFSFQLFLIFFVFLVFSIVNTCFFSKWLISAKKRTGGPLLVRFLGLGKNCIMRNSY